VKGEVTVATASFILNSTERKPGEVGSATTETVLEPIVIVLIDMKNSCCSEEVCWDWRGPKKSRPKAAIVSID
jgi:hypothetical protein